MPDILPESKWRLPFMKKLLLVFSVVAILSLLAAPAFAAGDMTCDHDGETIESLHHCVMHASDMAHIDNKGVAKSLTAKLDGAQAALDRGQTRVAVNKLNAFINEVNAQSGKHIAADHAGMLVEHANKVIAALGG
jgi:hypothetical protein